MSDYRDGLVIGRMVHYRSFGTPGGEYASLCRAAIVAAVARPGSDGMTAPLDLTVLNPTGLFFNRVDHDSLPPVDKIVAGERTEHRGGTWHWPRECRDGA
jgi:hypothetical protein